jgi:hypothetical protein
LRRPSLRSQLNQIRLWVRQGRTDAWIAHKLDISVEQLRTFKREQGVNGEPGPASPPPPLDQVDVDQVELMEEEESADEGALSIDTGPLPDDVAEPEEDLQEDEREDRRDEETEREPRRRRRGRRGGRRRSGKPAGSFEATFDHGDEGYGLWLDPAVADSEVYTEHWAGHRAVSVTVEPDAITIRRVDRD